MSANQLAVTIDDISEANAPVIYVKDGLKPFLQAVKEEVSSQVPDLKTAKGRERIASLAAKVSKSKVAVEKPGREYLKRLKEMPKVVEAELREFVDAMDALRDETRKPLSDWETEQQARKDKHVDAVQAIHDFCADLTDVSAADLLESITLVEAVQMGDHWEEFETEAARAKESTLTKLRAALATRQQYEAEQAELVRLRAEAEAQAQRDREAQIAREAEDRARREAEERAQAERDAATKREAEAKAAADRRELELTLQAEQAERQAVQAKADKLAAEQRAEQDRIAAEQRQAEAVAKAQRDEIARQAAEAARVKLEAEAREADLEHKKKTNRAALEAFVAGGMTEECAKQAITLIAQRKIPAIAITY
ncbi:hypothetical protein [Pseudomonas sp. GM67]|uniref:hypothetical protein n=1 Tax=Pseudomonas sp. GM67 TaxID=1144335 RepID=UPI000270C37A|nr:hypothetical protein [Pseudomonas sp. GM67]EJM92456.1 hypothetical protein PMI33_00713 [Pseudomonas sp. GM67]